MTFFTRWVVSVKAIFATITPRRSFRVSADTLTMTFSPGDRCPNADQTGALCSSAGRGDYSEIGGFLRWSLIL